MPQADITVQYLNINKKNPKYASIKSSEGDYYSCSPKQLEQFTIGEVCTIAYTVNEKGYNDFLKKVSSQAAPKQNTRASASYSDALHIFVNGKLAAFIASGEVKLALTEIVEATNLLVDAYRMSKLSGNKAQTRDDLQDEIGF